MRRPGGFWRGVALGCAVGWGAWAWGGEPAPEAPRGLEARIAAIVEAPRYEPATWGIHVVSLDSGRVLYSRNARKRFIPASNAKLFTAALALSQPGGDFRIRTSLYAENALDPAGTLAGNLILYGRGDPTVLTRGRGTPDPLDGLAAQAWARGLRAVEGDVVGDDSFFATPPFGSGWECGDLPSAFGAEPSALCIHGNTVTLRIYPAPVPGQPCFVFALPGHGLVPLVNRSTTQPGPETLRVQRNLGDRSYLITGSMPPGAPPVEATLSVHEPALLFAQLLKRALERRGIPVKGQARAVHSQDRACPFTGTLPELGHLESPPLRAILKEALKDSNNLEAQLAFLQAGAASGGEGPGTEAKGTAALGACLERAGIPSGSVLMEEGSGLSRKDLVTPEAVTALLAHMSRTPEAAFFRDALPMAGLDGTLGSRMRGTAAQGRIWAKTGTLRYTHALSGYATTAAGERLAFSILLNNAPPLSGAPSPQADLDAIAVALAETR